MANRLTTEILINLAGNLTAKARQYGANMSEFARRNEQAMSIVKSTAAAAGRGLDALGNRYTGLIAGFGSSAMLKSYATLDRRISRMAVSAEVSRTQSRDMYREIEKYASKNAIGFDELADAFDQIVEKTGDYKRAMEQLPTLSEAIGGTGVAGHYLGDLSVFFGQLGILSRPDVQKALDIMNKQGKVGEFSFADAASVGAPVFAALSGYGGKGVEGVREAGALLQYGMNATADKSQAATSVLSFMTDAMNKQGLIKKYTGIDVLDKNGVFNPAELFEKLINRAAKNPNGIRLFMQEDPNKKIGALGFSEPALKLMAAGFSDYKNHGGKLVQMGHYMDVDGDGSIAADARVVAQDFTSSMQRLINAFEIFKEKNLAEPVQKVADAFNSLNSDDAQAWLEVGKNIAITTAGIVAARKAFQIGKGAWDLLGGGKSKGIPKGVSEVFGSGVMPVYVVNMKDGMSGGSNNELPGRSYPPSKYDKGGLIGAAINTAAEISELVQFPETDDDKKALLQRVKENNERSTMWQDIKDWLTSSSQPPAGYQDPSPWASMQPQNQPGYPFLPQQLQGEVKVVVEDNRVRVSSVKINAPGVTMSAQSGVSNVEQD
ncbi:phage tail tape measure protein [Klebsiella michiganensis]